MTNTSRGTTLYADRASGFSDAGQESIQGVSRRALDFLIPKDPSADTRDVRSRFIPRSLRFVRSFLVLSYLRKRVYITFIIFGVSKRSDETGNRGAEAWCDAIRYK